MFGYGRCLPMTAIPLTERIEQLFEPAARAARRGDADQIRGVLNKLHSIWKSDRKLKKVNAAEELARGMTFAIEGMLGILLASSGADARHALIEGRKYALPVLHVLGKKAHASANDPRQPDASLQMGELAKLVGMYPQNLSELVKAMGDCGLVSASDQGQARHVVITDVGLEILEASKPGWQLLNLDQDDLLNQRLEEAVRQAQKTFAATIQHEAADDMASRHVTYPVYGKMLHSDYLGVRDAATIRSQPPRLRYRKPARSKYATLGQADASRTPELVWLNATATQLK